MDPGLWEAAAAEQEARRLEDPWEERLRDILGEMGGKIRTEDVWTIVGVPVDRRAQEHNARLGSAMRKLGWGRIKRRFGERDPEWAYVRAKADCPERRILVQMEGQMGREKAVAYYEGEELPF